MCEPYHSIVQYPHEDDSGPTKGRLDAASSGSKLLSWGKKVLDFFHFSKLGSGHSGATGFGFRQELLLPSPTSYEAHWWDRTVHLDGEFRGASFNKEFASEAAEEYAQRTSIGSLSIFRRFFEGSLRATIRPYGYLDRFLSNMLNQKGRDSLNRAALSFLNVKMSQIPYTWNRLPCRQEELVKLVMGYTRKRELLLPPWADDDKLWTP